MHARIGVLSCLICISLVLLIPGQFWAAPRAAKKKPPNEAPANVSKPSSAERVAKLQTTQKDERLFHGSGGFLVWFYDAGFTSVGRAMFAGAGLEAGIRIKTFDLVGQFSFDAGGQISKELSKFSGYYRIEARYGLPDGAFFQFTVRRARFQVVGKHTGLALLPDDNSFTFFHDTQIYEFVYNTSDFASGFKIGLDYHRPKVPIPLAVTLYDSFNNKTGEFSYIDRSADLHRFHFILGYNSLGNIQKYTHDLSKFYIDLNFGIGMFFYARGDVASAATANISRGDGGPLSALLAIDIGYLYRSLNREIPDSGVTLKIGYRASADVMFLYQGKSQDTTTQSTSKSSNYRMGRFDWGHGPYVSFVKSF